VRDAIFRGKRADNVEIIMKNPCKACNNNIKPHIWCDKKREYIKYLDGNTVLKDKSISVSPKAMPTRKRGNK